MLTQLLRVVIKRACRRYTGFCLQNIAFSLNSGELLLVCGPSGSGKTTLARVVAGVFDGDFEGFVEARGPLAYLPQEPWRVLVGPTVRHDLLLASANPFHAASRYGLIGVLDSPVHRLSAGQVQKLALAVVEYSRPRIVVLDEPSVYLDEEARRLLRELVAELLDRGGTAVLVDHEPLQWVDLAAKTLVLVDGKPKCFGSTSECNSVIEELSRLSTVYCGHCGRVEAAVSLENVWFRYPGSKQWVLKGVFLEAYRGEITCIVGPNGAGKTTLLKTIAGIYKPTRGHIRVYGKPVYVPENPLLYYTAPTVYEEVVGGARDQGYGEEVLKRLNLWSLRNRPLAVLSAGERRRVAVASALARGYDIVLLDEPSAGLDRWSLKRLVEVLCEAASSNAAIVAASHDRRFLAHAHSVVEVGSHA